MKAIFKYVTIVVAALSMGFTSCISNDDPEIGNVVPGKPTVIEVSISTPRIAQTYAADDSYATEEEVALKSIDVLIYGKSGGGFILQNSFRKDNLIAGDYSKNSPDTYTLTDKIETTTGEKKIFVALNLPAGIVTLPAENTSISEVAGLIASITDISKITSTGTGFTMFSTKATDATLVTPDNAAYSSSNKISATVERLVAKITVEEGSSLMTSGYVETDGGWISGLQYALCQYNTQMYLLPQKTGNKVLSPNNDNLTTDSPVSYNNVNATNVIVYATENTMSKATQDKITYVSVRGKFLPRVYNNSTGGVKSNNNTTANTAATFWTVILTSGEIYYFDDVNDATSWKNANANSKLQEYTDGYCYYQGYFNVTNTDNPYGVIRNEYYKTTIKSIAGLGAKSDGEVDFKEATLLTMDIEVKPWVKRPTDWDL